MTEPTIHIRQGQAQDAQALADFNSAMAFETEAVELIPEVILKGVQTLIANPHHGYYLVAEVEGEIVASLMVTTEWSDWRNGVFWWVQSVYVVPQWRRKGLTLGSITKLKRWRLSRMMFAALDCMLNMTISMRKKLTVI